MQGHKHRFILLTGWPQLGYGLSAPSPGDDLWLGSAIRSRSPSLRSDFSWQFRSDFLQEIGCDVFAVTFSSEVGPDIPQPELRNRLVEPTGMVSRCQGFLGPRIDEVRQSSHMNSFKEAQDCSAGEFLGSWRAQQTLQHITCLLTRFVHPNPQAKVAQSMESIEPRLVEERPAHLQRRRSSATSTSSFSSSVFGKEEITWL